MPVFFDFNSSLQGYKSELSCPVLKDAVIAPSIHIQVLSFYNSQTQFPPSSISGIYPNSSRKPVMSSSSREGYPVPPAASDPPEPSDCGDYLSEPSRQHNQTIFRKPLATEEQYNQLLQCQDDFRQLIDVIERTLVCAKRRWLSYVSSSSNTGMLSKSREGSRKRKKTKETA